MIVKLWYAPEAQIHVVQNPGIVIKAAAENASQKPS